MKVFVRIMNLVLIMIVVLSLFSIVFARNEAVNMADGGSGSGKTTTKGPITSTYGSATLTGSGATMVQGIGERVIGALQVVATVIAIGALLMIGMKLLTSSPAEKANAKTMLTPYIVAVVLMFAAIPILSIIYKLFN